MRKGILFVLTYIVLANGPAFGQMPKDDVFRGKLFAPNIVLENRAALNLTRDQYTAIRAAVVEVQADVAEQEWDMQEAYQALMLELDNSPVDADGVLKHVSAALMAENQVKKKQIAMLVKLKNLLTAEQIAYLESVVSSQ